VLGANNLAFKINGSKSIFVFQESNQNHQKFDDRFLSRVLHLARRPGRNHPDADGR